MPQKSTKLLNVLLLLIALAAIGKGKKEQRQEILAVKKETPAVKAEKPNTNRLAGILSELKTMDSHDVAALHRILMHGRLMKKLNKALKKEAKSNRILVRLSSSDTTKGKEGHDRLSDPQHHLKRLMMIRGNQAATKLENQKNVKAKEDAVLGMNKKLDAKKVKDDMPHKNSKKTA